MKVVDVKEDNPNEIYNLFDSKDLAARFSKWDGKHMIKEISIDTFWTRKKVELVSYCRETDAIEIHYYRSSEIDSFEPVTFELQDCKLDCIRVIVLEYLDSDEITKCSSTYAEPDTQPKTRRGNILVGNP